MIAAAFAIDDIGGMGWKGGMPWPHNKDDMRWFKTLTQGHIVVMGKRTWESTDMPTPLPGRHNVVFTNNFFDCDEIEQIKGDVCEALKTINQQNKKQKVFVIGGPNLLLQTKPMLEKVYLTRIAGEFFNDVQIDIDEFLVGLTLTNTINLGSCIVEEYINETISSSTSTRTRKRKEQD
jgi:dihydrofolate reductase